ncbi:hypothetical protein KMS_R33570 [Pseudomonas sp. LRP2-20]|uniref:hypothetical protein n=1 Tax=Pseudomonas sp. LRP2-20 TaxID=2944234 RepID=UPI0021851B9E|nr:hypothetical protein [Pseudomonas sp. LRP2-20]BDM23600.1 hypothetical protein KMS_R33570 [Pseudomonas sp. LRP2-20]
MAERLSQEYALEIIRAAFEPFRCEAALDDAGTLVGFRVFNSLDETMFSCQLDGKQFSSRDRLRSILSIARETVERQGVRLYAWSI